MTPNPVLNALFGAMSAKGWPVFQGTGDRPHNLTLIGVRNPNPQPQSFDDLLFVVWGGDDGGWWVHGFPITTDPGLYWLHSPGRVHGTAILKEGRYPGLWGFGLHRGEYEALVQKSPATVYRDNNRDSNRDTDSPVETGIFGINLHRAGVDSARVEKWSAGCQVFKRRSDFALFMGLARAQKLDGWGASFSYCLIDAGPDWPALRVLWEVVNPKAIRDGD